MTDGKIQLKASAGQLVANFGAIIDALPLGTLKQIYAILLPDEPKLTGRNITKRYRSILRKHVLSANMPKPAPAPAPRKLVFAPQLQGGVCTYTTRKTADEVFDKCAQRIEQWLADNRAALDKFCVGKASGASPLKALRSRYTDRYSKEGWDYTSMVLLYEDTGTDARAHKEREKRALALEERLQARYQQDARWDERVDDAPGAPSRTRSARFYVYLAYKMK
jgi:hypothetical protein